MHIHIHVHTYTNTFLHTGFQCLCINTHINLFMYIYMFACKYTVHTVPIIQTLLIVFACGCRQLSSARLISTASRAPPTSTSFTCTARKPWKFEDCPERPNTVPNVELGHENPYVVWLYGAPHSINALYPGPAWLCIPVDVTVRDRDQALQYYAIYKVPTTAIYVYREIENTSRFGCLDPLGKRCKNGTDNSYGGRNCWQVLHKRCVKSADRLGGPHVPLPLRRPWVVRPGLKPVLPSDLLGI